MHEGHRKRLKNRFLTEGLASFDDHEVLELLLFYAIPQGDTNPLAHRLLDKFHTLSAVLNASISELCTVKGISEHSATLLKLIPDISRFYVALSGRSITHIRTPEEAGAFACAQIGGERSEVFLLLCLDAQKKLIAFEELERGTSIQADIHPRKIVECALRHNATSVILVHNHPWGGEVASESDREITKKLCSLLGGMGISVDDHIIALGTEKYLSLKQAEPALISRTNNI